MKVIAFSFLALFATFTVVLSTYFLWQGNKVLTMLPVEEEDHCKGANLEIPFMVHHEPILFEFVYVVKSDDLVNHNTEPFYEDVLKNTPYSPPDYRILS